MMASDYYYIMKITLFVLDNIFDEWNQITCENFCNIYVKFSKMYIVSRKESFTKDTLKNFEVSELD
jgi:hypothetical protein